MWPPRDNITSPPAVGATWAFPLKSFPGIFVTPSQEEWNNLQSMATTPITGPLDCSEAQETTILASRIYNQGKKCNPYQTEGL